MATLRDFGTIVFLDTLPSLVEAPKARLPRAQLEQLANWESFHHGNMVYWAGDLLKAAQPKQTQKLSANFTNGLRNAIVQWGGSQAFYRAQRVFDRRGEQATFLNSALHVLFAETELDDDVLTPIRERLKKPVLKLLREKRGVVFYQPNAIEDGFDDLTVVVSWPEKN